MHQIISKLILSSLLIILPLSVQGSDYFSFHLVTAFDPNYKTLTLDDGSVWNVDPNSVPTVQSNPNWQLPGYVWILPALPQGGWSSDGLLAILFLDLWFIPISARLEACTTALTINQDSNPASGTISLSDNTTWTLDPAYERFYTTWQPGDSIIYAGSHVRRYLINSTPSQQCQTFSAASSSSME